ncbi:hypothetical protein V8C42DRAFT_336886 [Trichoderma barbatum]
MRALHKYLICVFFHLMPSIPVLYFAGKILSNNNHTTQGLVKYTFDHDLSQRGLPDIIPQSIPESIPQDLPDAISQIGSKATDIGSIIPSQVKSAIDSVETKIAQGLKSIPKGYSIGTKSACIIYDPHIQCQDLPIKSTSVLEGITNLLPPLKALSAYLTKTPSLEVILVMGLAFHLISISTYILVKRVPKIRFVSAALSLISAAFIGTFIGFALTVFSFTAKLKQSGTIQRSELYCGLIGCSMHVVTAIGCAIVKF